MKINNDLTAFLNSNNIYIADKKNEKYVDDFKVKMLQIDNIVKVQKTILNYNNPYSLGLCSFIWRDIEIFKMWNRRGRKLIKDYKLHELEPIVSEAEKSIDMIYKIPYLNLIHRSMKKNEICIGKVSENNLWGEDVLKILDLKKLGFNLIEHDCYKYLSKFKRKNISLDYYKTINHFIECHGLDNNSKIYIEALLSYPYNAMKIIQKEYLKERITKEDILVKFYDESLI